MLSALSNIPPCPGKIFPESFKFVFLFRNESNKSPAIENKTINNPIAKLNKKGLSDINDKINENHNEPNIKEEKKPE